jgi:O-antigen ligase/polysaccharide polymerase Wzy-like membrane protein
MSTLAFRLYLLFICSWFVHLPTRISALGAIRADLLLVCVIFVLTIISTAGDDGQTASAARTRKILWVLVLYAAATIPLVEWPGSVVKNGFPNFFKAFVFFYFTQALVTTPQRLKQLLLVFVACQTFRVLEPVYLHVTTGYWGSAANMDGWVSMVRLSGAPDDIVNPNGLAFIILTVVSFVHYLTRASVIGRLLYVGLLFPLMYALVLTGSRSGMVGLAGILLIVWLKSRYKVTLIAIVSAAVVIAMPLLSDDLTDRYQSIFDSDTRNAVTVQDRVEGAKINWAVALRRPFFGHGLGTSREANANFSTSYLLSHDLYIETAQELGFIGLAIFLAFIASLLWDLARAGRAVAHAESPPPIVPELIPALQVFICMNVLFSFASYGLSSYDWYFAAGLTDVVYRFLVPHAAATAAVAASAAPLPAAAALRPVATSFWTTSC